MTNAQVKKDIKRLAKEGMPYKQIAEKIKASGHVSKRSGESLGPVRIGQIARNQGVRRHNIKPKRAKAPATRAKASLPAKYTGKLAAIRSILNLKAMDSEERVALALLVLG